MSVYLEEQQRSLKFVKAIRELIKEIAITKSFNPRELIEDDKRVYPNIENVADRLIMAKIELSEDNVSFEGRNNLREKIETLKKDIKEILLESSKKMEEQSYFEVGIEKTKELVDDLIKHLDIILLNERLFPEFKKLRKEQIGY